MVSKVAVMALVAVIAVPILLGYALNLSEQTVTEYKPDGDSVNVTPLLKNDTAYTNAFADSYSINSNFTFNGSNPIMPIYSTTTANTSTPLQQYIYDAGAYPSAPLSLNMWRYMFFKSNYDGAGSINFRVDDTSDGTYISFTNVYSVYWDHNTNKLNITEINNSHTALSHSWDYTLDEPISNYNYQFTATADYSSTGVLERAHYDGSTTTFIDYSKGYYFDQPLGPITNKMPDNTRSVMMTVDLSSITDSSYMFSIGASSIGLRFDKTTVGGVPVWSLTNTANSEVIADNLYYDTSRSSNTYQIYVDKEVISPNSIYPNEYDVNYHVECRYVGDWPTLIGAANYYQNYQYDYFKRFELKQGINSVSIGTSGTKTPTVRMDQVLYPAFSYYVINNNTYNPADFKTNPTTTLENVQKYGISLEFGGNTYTVDKSGNITMGTHKVSVDGIKLESVPVVGGYENRINGTAISVTAQPSTIKFNGYWGVSVSTVANAASSYTHTEWTAGEFGWNGIDQNFLMVGLLTSLGAFIALGIYIRRTKAALWPLLIVCGGAAMLFFCML